MTKFLFISELLNIINSLLEAGINGCNIHEIRGYLDELFDEFEEHEGTTIHEKNEPSDLELYSYIIANIHEEGYNLWLEDKDDNINMNTISDEAGPKEKSATFCTNQFFRELNDMITIGESEGDTDGT